MASAGISVSKEPQGLSRSDGKHSLISWQARKPLSWDVTVVWPLANLYVAAAAREAGSVTELFQQLYNVHIVHMGANSAGSTVEGLYLHIGYTQALKRLNANVENTEHRYRYRDNFWTHCTRDITFQSDPVFFGLLGIIKIVLIDETSLITTRIR